MVMRQEPTAADGTGFVEELEEECVKHLLAVGQLVSHGDGKEKLCDCLEVLYQRRRQHSCARWMSPSA